MNKLNIYIRLMRINKPIGTLLLLYPTLWAVWLAAHGTPTLATVLAFSLGTFFMRSAGCVVNDWADRDFDGHVERTQHRPFATGEVSTQEAKRLIVVLCALSALCLIPFSWQTWVMALPALFLAFTYPFMKRFFSIPQLYLGLAFSFGIPMAFVAIQGEVPLLAWALFAGNVFWTLAYDTLYAMADKPDDLKIGIKTSAIKFGRYDAEMALLCHVIFDLIMLGIGLNIEASWVFYVAWFWVLYEQIQQYRHVMTRDRQQCLAMFLANNKIGIIWLVAIMANSAFYY